MGVEQRAWETRANLGGTPNWETRVAFADGRTEFTAWSRPKRGRQFQADAPSVRARAVGAEHSLTSSSDSSMAQAFHGRRRTRFLVLTKGASVRAAEPLMRLHQTRTGESRVASNTFRLVSASVPLEHIPMGCNGMHLEVRFPRWLVRPVFPICAAQQAVSVPGFFAVRAGLSAVAFPDLRLSANNR